MNDSPNREELERLWRAVKRDLLFEIEAFAGLHGLTEGENRGRRLRRNWRRLCELDGRVGANLASGFQEVSMVLSAAGSASLLTSGDAESRSVV
jgi:hypothetical protein